MASFYVLTLGIAFCCFCVLDPVCCQDNDISGINVGKCLFPTHKSWTDSQKEALWKLGPLMGKRYTVTLPEYTYSVGVCTTALEGMEENSVTAAIQHEKNPDSETEPDTATKHVLGQFNDTTFMSGTDWAMLEYKSGENYGSHCAGEKRRTMLMIICDPSETGVGTLRIIEENNFKTTGCFYLFELSHNSACSIQQTGLSIGSIICIVVVCIAGVYLVGGVLYQRFVAGAKGIEQIPHLHFWRDFGNLQADGCDFLCRCGYKRSTRSYRGVGDDQLGTSQEEATLQDDDRDDHLLPM